MSPTLPLATSTSFSAPRFSVTSRRPSGRKAIAHGSSQVAISVLAKGRELLVDGSAAAWDAAWDWASCALAGCPGALPGELQALRARLAPGRTRRGRVPARLRFQFWSG